MFEDVRSDQTVKYEVLLLQDLEAPVHVLPQQPVLALHVEDVSDSHQQTRRLDLRPQRGRVLGQVQTSDYPLREDFIKNFQKKSGIFTTSSDPPEIGKI